RRRDQRVPECDVMAPGPPEPYRIPAVLDLPASRRQKEAPDERGALGGTGERLAVPGRDAETEDPVGVLAAAGEWPPSSDPPAFARRLGRSGRLARAGNDRVRTIPIDLVVGLARQQGRKHR